MVIVARIDKVYRYTITLLIKQEEAIFVSLIMQGLRVTDAIDGDTLEFDAFLLVEPDRILVEVGKGFLGIAILLDALLKYLAYALYHTQAYR